MIKRKEDARDEAAKERCMEAYKEENRMVKRCIYQSKKEVNEQFCRKMNHDVNGNRNLLWKEVSKMDGGKVRSCSRVKAGNSRMAL